MFYDIRMFYYILKVKNLILFKILRKKVKKYIKN